MSEQHYEKCAERQADGLHRDARVRALEHGRDAAQRQAFKERVNRGGDRSPILFKDGNQRDDEAAEKAAHHPRNGRSWCCGVRQAPGPRGCGHDAEQEQAGFVDGALHRHRLAVGDLAFKCLIIQCWIGCAHQICHCENSPYR